MAKKQKKKGASKKATRWTTTAKKTALSKQVKRANKWIQKRHPGAIDRAGCGLFTQGRGGISVTNDWVMAYLVGGWGMPKEPTVYCEMTGGYYLYDARATVYREIRPNQVVQRLAGVVETCGQDTGSAALLTGLKSTRFAALPSVLAGLVDQQPDGLGSPIKRHGAGFLQVLNGRLDLATLTLSPAVPSNAGVWRIPVPWVPDAKSPTRFLAFLKEIMPDEDDRELLLDLLASAFVGNPSQKLLILRGTGGSGKSTLIKLIRLLIGEGAAGELGLGHAKERFTAINWLGKLLLVESEASQAALDGAYSELKRLTGQDTIFADRKNRSHLQFTSEALPILVSNEHLTIRSRGDQAAWERRAVILDAAEPPKDREAITGLHDTLVELEGPAILKVLATRAAQILSEERSVRPLNAAQRSRVTARFSFHAYLTEWAQERLTSLGGALCLYRDEAWQDFQRWAAAKGYATGPSSAPTPDLREIVEEIGGVWSQSLPKPANREKAGILALKGWRGVGLRG
ncbi:MAG: hypothetical protein EA350_05380 [Gemmatimonadales bacterium]|nr:MAG: hypothetical protein EA350_05380 [Gemmatimonadales bacterium]